MPSKISNNVQLSQSLISLNDVVKFWALTILPFEKMFLQKLVNLGKLCKDKTMDFYLIKYLPGMTKISRHGQIYNALTKKTYASPT